MNMKKVIPLGIAGCLALGGLSFALNGDIEQKIIKKPMIASSTQDQQNQDIKVKSKKIKVENEFINIDMNIPMIEGMKDKKYQDQLNNTIMNKAIKDQEKIEKEAKEYNKKVKEQGVAAIPYELFVDYSVKSNDDILSFTVQTYIYTAGANGTPRTDCYNIYLKENKNIQIKDLFKEKSDYKKVISEEIKKQMKKQEAEGIKTYFHEDGTIDKEKVFQSIKEDQSFYIEDGNVVICFSKYEIAPGASGEPEFKISLKGLENILKDKDIIKDLNYSIEEKVLAEKSNNIKIAYPQIKDYPGELTQDYMNQSLQQIADIYKKDGYKDVKINYEITKMNDEILSVLFSGTGKMNGKDINIEHSVNLDMKKSGNEIDFENLIKKGEPSKKAVMKILNDQAKVYGLKEVEAEGIRVYFKSDKVVFYYMPLDDSATEFIKLEIKKEKIAPYMNTDFGEPTIS